MNVWDGLDWLNLAYFVHLNVLFSHCIIFGSPCELYERSFFKVGSRDYGISYLGRKFPVTMVKTQPDARNLYIFPGTIELT